jgi:hypothetical protein
MNKQLKKIQHQQTNFNNSLENLFHQQKKLQKALLVYQKNISDFLKALNATEVLYDAIIPESVTTENYEIDITSNEIILNHSAGSVTGNQGQLLSATKQMQETQMSFDLLYLQLQSQMQHENRRYTAISNIMKTKHDTVKNSISNVR